MGDVLRAVCGTGSLITKNFGSNHSAVWLQVDIALDATALTQLLASGAIPEVDVIELSSHTSEDAGAEWYVDTGPVVKWAAYNPGGDPASTPHTPSPAIASLQFYTVKIHLVAGSPIAQTVWVDGVSIGTVTVAGANMADIRSLTLFEPGLSSGNLYFDNVMVGTTEGGSDIFSDNFESGNTSNWTTVDAAFTVVTDPGIAPAGTGALGTGRVLIAFDDLPLEPSPVWTVIDQGGAFPYNFVAGYDIRVGRQTLLTQTDTGTATVTIYDRTGLFDPRNVSSPYYGKLDGRQITLQLYNPVTATWEPQFRGLIDDIEWAVDGSAVNASGEPVNETITLNCVDMFDYLAGYGLTPGLDGVVPPPAGKEDGVYYAATAGSVEDRINEILDDANIDSTMRSVASGNVHVKEVKYDPDESALQALRDAGDAELPFIANIYCDRYGHFAFRGRYGRFDPDDVSAEVGSDWDFTRWKVGDGAAILSDSTRAQMRILSFGRARSELVNAALCYPQGVKAADMPAQVFADTTSITDFGKHSAPPMSDLLCDGGVDTAARPSGTTDLVETALFAELLVKNQKDPRENITAIQLKSMQPDHTARATATWAMLTRVDISHAVNVAVGYPGGTGFTGMATVDDYYVEGRQLHVTPANSGYDYVELDLDLSAAVWSMDTHGVFPAFPG